MVYHKGVQKNVFEELRIAIMKGTYTPRERLVERDLSKSYGVSRTPIREAIYKLEEIGLVRRVPNQGASVTCLSSQDIESLYDARLLLEGHAAKIACLHISSEEIENLIKINVKLSQAVSSLNFPQMIENDQNFHITLCKFSKNPYFIKTIEDLRLKSYPVSYFFWKSNVDLRSSISEHDEIIKFLKNREEKNLKLAIDKNLTKAKQRYLNFLSEF